ncbi:MAG: ABC transporter ATP-binding protein [Pseudomonadota bacterium]|nr:ABC transporter ATP-binding protein [Pseudomonadota bacterium]
MIRLEHISKRFGPGLPPAVDDLSLEIPDGSTCALIGPSGCGKTTTMRIVNRLIEPSAGRVLVAGEDVTRVDPVMLRRRIGYVIQQVGLFPHMSVADNVATVPRLLKWPEAKTRARVDELLRLVGLDPESVRARYPRELSGGQRQRVGVARALAADPPVMLMDEPFGAIDPITRARLQDEFQEILKRVRKTVVLVTHDMDEAIKMGDRIALMRDGRLVQYDTPEAVLTRPADAFVEAFVGADRALKRLGLAPVRAVMTPGADGPAQPSIRASASLRDALAAMLAQDVTRLTVVEADGRPLGTVTRDAVLDWKGSRPDGDATPAPARRSKAPHA